MLTFYAITTVIVTILLLIATIHNMFMYVFRIQSVSNRNLIIIFYVLMLAYGCTDIIVASLTIKDPKKEIIAICYCENFPHTRGFIAF